MPIPPLLSPTRPDITRRRTYSSTFRPTRSPPAREEPIQFSYPLIPQTTPLPPPENPSTRHRGVIRANTIASSSSGGRHEYDHRRPRTPDLPPPLRPGPAPLHLPHPGPTAMDCDLPPANYYRHHRSSSDQGRGRDRELTTARRPKLKKIQRRKTRKKREEEESDVDDITTTAVRRDSTDVAVRRQMLMDPERERDVGTRRDRERSRTWAAGPQRVESTGAAVVTGVSGSVRGRTGRRKRRSVKDWFLWMLVW